ncbi:FixH family protein [Lacimicrobium sp. SS2-24]|uniref:FixH family protein n=1 Tax=Lacimicrobium sp. SS2-24 TaxID=2005569 RepID=UPI000B4BEF15|nr:FixH family protein [Lacimicrobium sp. SS2-24]
MNPMPPPWYKQFWPWFLIAIPVVSIALSINLLRLATTGQDSMVIEDYYKEGKAINMRLEKITAAQNLGIETLLSVDDDTVVLNFTQGAPSDGTALKLFFQHPTLQDEDFQLMLTRNSPGRYSGELPRSISGKWHLTLEPFDQQWRIYQVIGLPRQDPIRFIP